MKVLPRKQDRRLLQFDGFRIQLQSAPGSFLPRLSFQGRLPAGPIGGRNGRSDSSGRVAAGGLLGREELIEWLEANGELISEE